MEMDTDSLPYVGTGMDLPADNVLAYGHRG